MANKLVIVESPKKAKTIKNILGSGYTVVATVGHIADLHKGKGGDIGVDIVNGFKPKYRILPDKKDKVAAIFDAAKICSEILIASDKDREGELIGQHVYEQLNKLSKPISRIEFSEITKAGITKGLNNPRKINDNLCDAAKARRVLDRIVGFTVSPYISKKLIKEKLSAGRVQSVALKIIVDRDRDINAFVPEEFWTISSMLANKSKSKFVARYSKKITDKKTADKVKKDLLVDDYEVVGVDSKERIKPALCPFTTPLLQQEAYSKFKLSPEKTMKIAQSLYEAGLITYIRTDSVRCSPESIDAARNWIVGAGYDVPKKAREYKNKDAAQNAHEAIRPTDVSLHPDEYVATEDEQKIYAIVWARFVASQMNDAIYDTVSVVIRTSHAHELKAEGKTLKYAGWLEIYGQYLKKEKDIVLPKLSVGDALVLVTPPGVKSEKKKTSPPPRYNVKSLIDDLDKKAIGRPSTYATILKKISERKYVKETKKGFEATDLGIEVVSDLEKYFSFMEYNYTAKMEKQLDLLADGKEKYIDVMTEFFSAFKGEFQRARGSDGIDTGFNCPKCGDKMIVRHSQYGYFAGCIKYPDCKSAIGVKIVDGQVVKNEKHSIVPDVQCPVCGDGMVRRDGKFGPFYSCAKYPKCLGKRKVPFGKKCSCGGELYLTVFNGEKKLACMNYPGCTNIEDVPEDAPNDWVLPETLGPHNLGNKVEKVVKSI